MFPSRAFRGPKGYQIENSMSLNASNEYMYQTLPNAAGVTKCVISAWVKRTELSGGSSHPLFTLGGDSSNYGKLYFGGSDQLVLFANTGGVTKVLKVSTRRFRDVGAWYHIYCRVDTTDGTAEDRFQLWVNGERISDWDTNTNTWVASTTFYFGVGSTKPTWIGADYAYYFGGYFSEYHFIYGDTPAVTEFGETNADSVWKPKQASGLTYGANGFFLEFQELTTDLGDDTSGNSNDFTESNTPDQRTDTPTNNCCILNSANNSGAILGGAALVATGDGAAAWDTVVGTMGASTGKWYFEMYVGGAVTESLHCGIWGNRNPYPRAGDWVGLKSYGWCLIYENSTSALKVYNAGALSQTLTDTDNIASTDVVQVAFDVDAGKLWFGKDGTWYDSGDPGAGTGESDTITVGEIYHAAASVYSSNSCIMRFNPDEFDHTPPTGFKALTANNIAAEYAFTNPAAHFKASKYTGNGTTKSVSGMDFPPDMVWIKNMDTTDQHKINDTVRGTTKELEPDANTHEVTNADGLTVFDADGFTVGADLEYNTNTEDYISWNWKGDGTSGASNTDGDIASTVNVNQDAGFSIVTFTGTGTNGDTVGHGLGKTPAFIVVKERDSGTNYEWVVYHLGLSDADAETDYVMVSLNNAAIDSNLVWNDTKPTDDVFSLGTSIAINESGTDYVAYCFAEIPGHCAVGRYEGSGSTNGPMITTAFRPAAVLIKKSYAVGAWCMKDSARSEYNPMDEALYADLTQADTAGNQVDFLANGFKLRSTNGATNTAATYYTYIAFAEHNDLSLAR